MTGSDEEIERVILAELALGQDLPTSAGFSGAQVSVSHHPRTETATISLGGRFQACADRDLEATVEVDPARLGWRLEGYLWEYLDSKDFVDQVAFLGSYRVESEEHAIEYARMLSTAAWVALRDRLVLLTADR
jgi:hypothetical protein